MKLYIYNINNKNEYIASKEVEITNESDIVEPYTAVEPPQAINGKCWCYNTDTDTWDKQIDDYRGSVIYSTLNSQVRDKVKFVGDIPDGYTTVEPPDDDKTYYFDGSKWNRIIIPKIYSKLSIRRACRKLGLETKLDTLLSSNATFKADWDDANEINLNDNVTSQALRTNAFTDAEYDAVIEELSK